MRFLCEHEELRVGLVLDDEPDAVDLTEDRLGARILDALVAGMSDAHAACCAPDGTPWPPLARSTIQRKGHAVIGIASGRSHITDPDLYRAMPRTIAAREAWWYVPRSHPRWPQMHGCRMEIPA
jgi:hypothetical protein